MLGRGCIRIDYFNLYCLEKSTLAWAILKPFSLSPTMLVEVHACEMCQGCVLGCTLLSIQLSAKMALQKGANCEVRIETKMFHSPIVSAELILHMLLAFFI